LLGTRRWRWLAVHIAQHRPVRLVREKKRHAHE
jgi:hypothetical protein